MHVIKGTLDNLMILTINRVLPLIYGHSIYNLQGWSWILDVEYG